LKIWHQRISTGFICHCSSINRSPPGPRVEPLLSGLCVGLWHLIACSLLVRKQDIEFNPTIRFLFPAALIGICYFFVRAHTKAISTANIANEVNFGVIDATDGNLLKGIEDLLGSVMVPALKAQKDWGQLTASGTSNQQQVFVDRLILNRG